MYVIHEQLAVYQMAERRAEAQKQRLGRQVVRERRRARREEREKAPFRFALMRGRVARQH